MRLLINFSDFLTDFFIIKIIKADSIHNAKIKGHLHNM